ncbi:hypothetical protein D3879_00495 [Pseudomonas cavernicola]|uniref:Uncharacterized protein n=1 Tax=Pseudomonas cavernicola TaxID=2320866 RepID=A0A418XH94_9PSED|nr:hypothetical protein D3879_00495 [Pseudomonas cavernicola]
MFGYRHDDLNRFNRPVRTRMPGGVAGEQPNGCPLCRFCDFCAIELFSAALLAVFGVAGQAFQGCAQIWVADAVGGSLDAVGGALR